METVRQQVDEILSGAAARRDISQATMDEIVEAQTAILYGLINAVRELANQVEAKTRVTRRDEEELSLASCIVRYPPRAW
jgi:hypothetical protein